MCCCDTLHLNRDQNDQHHEQRSWALEHDEYTVKEEEDATWEMIHWKVVVVVEQHWHIEDKASNRCSFEVAEVLDGVDRSQDASWVVAILEALSNRWAVLAVELAGDQVVS